MRAGRPGSGSRGLVNIDIVRQDGSFPSAWKSRGVGSQLVKLLLQQTNKREVCRLNRAEACCTTLLRAPLNHFTWDWSYLETVWQFAHQDYQSQFNPHMNVLQPRLDGISMTGKVSGNVVPDVAHH